VLLLLLLLHRTRSVQCTPPPPEAPNSATVRFYIICTYLLRPILPPPPISLSLFLSLSLTHTHTHTPHASFTHIDDKIYILYLVYDLDLVQYTNAAYMSNIYSFPRGGWVTVVECAGDVWPEGSYVMRSAHSHVGLPSYSPQPRVPLHQCPTDLTYTTALL